MKMKVKLTIAAILVLFLGLIAMGMFSNNHVTTAINNVTLNDQQVDPPPFMELEFWIHPDGRNFFLVTVNDRDARGNPVGLARIEVYFTTPTTPEHMVGEYPDLDPSVPNLPAVLDNHEFRTSEPGATIRAYARDSAGNEVMHSFTAPTLTLNIISKDSSKLEVEAVLDVSGYASTGVTIVVTSWFIQIHDELGNLVEKELFQDTGVIPAGVYTISANVLNPNLGETYYVFSYILLYAPWRIDLPRAEAYVTIEGVPICGLLEDLKADVAESPDECWVKKNSKATILNKLDECIALCEDEDLDELYDKLLHDIKPKLTGLKEDENGEIFGNGIFKNPWVVCEDLQASFNDTINEILTAIVESG